MCVVLLDNILFLFTLLDCLQEYRQYTPRAQNLVGAGGGWGLPLRQQTQRGLRSIPVKRQPKTRSAQWEVPIVLEN